MKFYCSSYTSYFIVYAFYKNAFKASNSQVSDINNFYTNRLGQK